MWSTNLVDAVPEGSSAMTTYHLITEAELQQAIVYLNEERRESALRILRAVQEREGPKLVGYSWEYDGRMVHGFSNDPTRNDNYPEWFKPRGYTSRRVYALPEPPHD